MTILLLNKWGESVVELVRSQVPDHLKLVTPPSRDRQVILSLLETADFVITIQMDGEMIEAAPRLKLIQLSGVGFDAIDMAAATRRGIPVSQAVKGTIVGVAEHTLLLILALYKQLLEADASLRRGEWLAWQLRPTSYTLEGKTVGLIGMGRIGREVARRCNAFDTQVCYHDVVQADEAMEKELKLHFLSQEKLIRCSDVVSLHLPLFPGTHRFFGTDQFRMMKSTAILINTARGELVDEEALYQALKKGSIAGAGLDVFDSEPPDPDHPLFSLKNIVLSPHIATGTRDSIIQKTRSACTNIQRVLDGKLPLDLVNPEIYEGD